MVWDKIGVFQGYTVFEACKGNDKKIQIKLGAFIILFEFCNCNIELYELVIQNLSMITDMQDSVVVLEWLKSFWKDLDNNLTVTLLANEAEDDSVYNYEEIVEIFNGRVKTIKANCDYYNAWIDYEKNWAFEIEGVRLENHSNISKLNDFQGFEVNDIVPKEYKDSMKIIISRLFRKYAQIQAIITA